MGGMIDGMAIHSGKQIAWGIVGGLLCWGCAGVLVGMGLPLVRWLHTDGRFLGVGHRGIQWGQTASACLLSFVPVCGPLVP